MVSPIQTDTGIITFVDENMYIAELKKIERSKYVFDNHI